MKQLYICEKHHHVLLPWAKIKRINTELNLLTFDYHTDTHDAFLNYLYCHKEESLGNLISLIDYNDDQSILNTIKKLKNDEHIDTAVKCNIFNKVFVISYDGAADKPSSNEFDDMHRNSDMLIKLMLGEISLPKVQTYPDSNVYVIGTYEYLDEENCIADDFLSQMLQKIQVMSKIDIMKSKYVLDIDLDYFQTYESLTQNNLDLFKKIISQSIAITIATEPTFAKEDISPDRILVNILNLVREVYGEGVEIIDLRDELKTI